ncbi:UNVERIFIED_ORG: hypothetical protein B2H93_19925 [Clostridium botulinum]
MKKIMEITEEQLNNLKNANNQVEVFKEIANIQEAGTYCIGDTTIKVNNSKKLDVFKEVFNDKNFYYIIVNPIDEELAFAYSLYPRH